eukprot:6183865-Pleurochrysis_carterae.AAC.2
MQFCLAWGFGKERRPEASAWRRAQAEQHLDGRGVDGGLGRGGRACLLALVAGCLALAEESERERAKAEADDERAGADARRRARRHAIIIVVIIVVIVVGRRAAVGAVARDRRGGRRVVRRPLDGEVRAVGAVVIDPRILAVCCPNEVRRAGHVDRPAGDGRGSEAHGGVAVGRLVAGGAECGRGVRLVPVAKGGEASAADDVLSNRRLRAVDVEAKLGRVRARRARKAHDNVRAVHALVAAAARVLQADSQPAEETIECELRLDLAVDNVPHEAREQAARAGAIRARTRQIDRRGVALGGGECVEAGRARAVARVLFELGDGRLLRGGVGARREVVSVCSWP